MTPLCGSSGYGDPFSLPTWRPYGPLHRVYTIALPICRPYGPLLHGMHAFFSTNMTALWASSNHPTFHVLPTWRRSRYCGTGYAAHPVCVSYPGTIKKTSSPAIFRPLHGHVLPRCYAHGNVSTQQAIGGSRTTPVGCGAACPDPLQALYEVSACAPNEAAPVIRARERKDFFIVFTENCSGWRWNKGARLL